MPPFGREESELMSDTEVRRLFAQAASEMVVGPAPSAVSASGRWSLSLLRRGPVQIAAVAASVAFVTLAWVVSVGLASGGDASPAVENPPATAPDKSGNALGSLDCPGGARGQGIYDYVGRDGVATPLLAAEIYTGKGEQAVVIETDRRSSTVAILRQDGSTRGLLFLEAAPDGGWFAAGDYTCGNDSLLGGGRK